VDHHYILGKIVDHSFASGFLLVVCARLADDKVTTLPSANRCNALRSLQPQSQMWGKRITLASTRAERQILTTTIVPVHGLCPRPWVSMQHDARQASLNRWQQWGRLMSMGCIPPECSSCALWTSLAMPVL
jgi:hypothetical protein